MFFTGRSHSRPISINASCLGLSDKFIAVLAMVEATGSMAEAGGYNHPVLGRSGHSLTPGGDTPGYLAPGAILTLDRFSHSVNLIILSAVYEYLVSMRDLLPHGLTGHALLYLGNDAGSQALGHRDTPLAIRPTGCLLLLSLKLHPFMAPEGDHGIEVSSASLKPSVGEEALVGPATVDLHTLGLGPRPQSVCVTRPCSVASQHVSVVAGVADHRLVADRRVLRLAIEGVMGDVTLDRDTGGQVTPGPSSVSLTYSCCSSNNLEAWLALICCLTPEGGAAALLEAMEDVLRLAAVNWQTREVRPIPGGCPIHKETFGRAKTLLSVRSETLEALIGQAGVHIIEGLVLGPVVGGVRDLGWVAAIVR